MTHREWKTLEDYTNNVEWYYWKFLLLDCSLSVREPPILSELPKLQLKDYIRDEAGRIVDPFWRWERILNTCRDVDIELYYRQSEGLIIAGKKSDGQEFVFLHMDDPTHFDLGAGQTSFIIPRARRSRQGKSLLNRGNAKHDFNSHWLQLGEVIKWRSRPSEQRKQKSLNARAYHMGIERDLQAGLILMQSARAGAFPF